MQFADRAQAGRLLARVLAAKEWREVLVLAIPRGGIEVAYPIAQELHAPLDLIIPRKIGAPNNPELAIGAVGPDGSVLLHPGWEHYGLNREELQLVVAREVDEIRRRMRAYRGELPPPVVAGKTVIVVDDGIATGATVEAALKSVQQQKPGRLVLAVPVAPPDTAERLRAQVDELICLQTPALFYAVGQFYESFPQTSDQTVIELLKSQRENLARG